MILKCLRLGRDECPSELCATHSAKSKIERKKKRITSVLTQFAYSLNQCRNRLTSNAHFKMYIEYHIY